MVKLKPPRRDLAAMAIAIGALLLTACNARQGSPWQGGSSARGNWNAVLRNSFSWKTKHASFESSILPASCALTVASNFEVEEMIKRLGLVEASADFSSSLEGLVLGSSAEKPSVWKECWEGYPGGLGFPSSCGESPRKYFHEPPGAFDPKEFSIGVCHRSEDAIVVANRSLRLRSGPL